MSQHSIVTKGIVLTRTNFGEAARIITMLTPDNGKVRLMAKGVRKVKSKLAGGIELFSISQITFIPGRGEISTLISSRLQQHYGTITRDINRTMFGYELIKTINKVTEDNAGEEYFDLLQNTLEALDEPNLPLDRLDLWLQLQLLKLAGHSPNVKTDTAGNKLTAEGHYNFSLDDMTFSSHEKGRYNAAHIKLLRLGLGLDSPKPLAQLQDIQTVLSATLALAKTMLQQHLRI